MNHSLISNLLMAATALGYAVAAAGFFFHLFRKNGSEPVGRIARRVLVLGALFHAGYVVHYSFAHNICPVATVNLGVSTGALIATAVYVIARRGLRLNGLGVVVAPVALVFLLAGRFISPRGVPAGIRSHILPVHIATNTIGVSLFVLASGAAAMFLIQQHQLKTKRVLKLFGRVPSLDEVDLASQRFLLLAFTFLTVGAVTGTLWVSRLTIGASTEVVRVTLDYAFWLIVAFVVLVRATMGWRRQRAAYGTLVGLVFALVVVSLYLSQTGTVTH